MRRRKNKYEVEDTLTIVEMLQGIGILLFLLFIIGVAGYVETHYDREDCTVVSVVGSCVTAEDKVGELWSYYTDTDSIVVGDTVTLHMFTNHTDNTIYDDEVIGVDVH